MTPEREAQIKTLVDMVVEKAMDTKKDATEYCGSMIATAFYDVEKNVISRVNVDDYKSTPKASA